MDSPDVTVVIPTYRTRNTIFKLLDSLANQSYKKFSIMLIYKPWKGYKETLDRIKDHSRIPIEFVKQSPGFFEEAMNTAYRKADTPITINTDDDAYVSKNWVKEHVELHIKHPKVGMATGIVDESTLPDGSRLPILKRLLNEQKWRMNKHTIIDKPIDQKFKNYGMYIGRSGMVVDTGKRYDMMPTFKQHGVNMSWKSEVINDFKLPGYTRNGVGNEQAAALEAIKRGYLPVWFKGGIVKHMLNASLSRGLSIARLPMELIVETVLFSYYVNTFSDYKINLGILKIRNEIDAFISRFIAPKLSIGYKEGYVLTRHAIEEGWQPAKVRLELEKLLKRMSS